VSDKFAIITGASTGIGFDLASIAAREGYDILVVADEPLIDAAAADFKQFGTDVRSVEADLSTFDGVERLLQAANGRKIDVLCANAGHGLGGAFLDQDPTRWRHVVDTNVTGTVYLLQRVLKDMTARGDGRVLVTGSIAGYMPGAFQAVYNGTKAFVDSFVAALQDELKDTSGVTITNLMPGATDTEFFDRADMLDTKVGTQKKDDPEKVAQDGWDAMMAGRKQIVSGLHNKLQTVMANVLPNSVLAHQHRNMAEPGSGE
jgi:short-subunit dehydrogenase